MNKYYSIIAPAKLNLNLFIKGKNKNGYHLLESDICFLELTDKIYIKKSNKDLFNQSKTPNNFNIDPNDNLIFKAINQFRILTKWNIKFEVYLDKKIPIGAGLGGGSADAASTLILLRNLYNKEHNIKKIDLSTLYNIGIDLGSDVPACLHSKDLRLGGYGNKITRTKVINNYYFLLINPKINLSTREVFQQYDASNSNESNIPDARFGNINIHNSLLSSAIDLAPQISSVLSHLQKSKTITAYGMTGSGSTCFGIFKNINEIIKFLEFFNKQDNPNYFIWYGQKKNYNMNRIRTSKTLENIV
ncbi:4-(cytidine 5'-diphospho)-2-C-methyl-D-erythritol kinase [Candidatus Levibacter sp. Uisw_134_01]|uniref:4-(cytidine 5'-diphospho)-2-C-methyl-D-erythritol kinase n=1 Tax=Candidatus Levibacter sp. Uisw_134_01 TaxID=3230999 RepID=UPI003D38B197